MPSTPVAANANIYSWIGPNNGTWSSSANWFDTTSGLNPAAFIPGALSPVWIINPAAAAETIQGGGSAASMAILGSVGLAGSYGVGGLVAIGTLAATFPFTLTPGTLSLAAGATLAPQTLNVLDGAFTLGGGSTVTVSGGLAVGLDGGWRIPNNGTNAYLPTTPGVVTVQSGAGMATGGDLALNAGTVIATGGRLAIGGGMTVGSAGTVSSQSPLTSAAATLGQVIASSGGSIAVAGNVTLPDGMLVADGTSSAVSIGGTVTASIGGPYTYFTSALPSTAPGVLVAVNGGSVQVGGLVLSSHTLAPVGDAVVLVDGTSAVEVGFAGNAAAGAVTIDSGRTVLAASASGIYANLVDNGTLIVTGGSVTQSGTVSGSGVVQIGRNGTWVLDGAIAPTVGISFTDVGAALAVGPDITLSGVTISPLNRVVPAVLSGFQAGDAIMVSDIANSASFTAGASGNPGTLTVSNGGTVIEQFLMTGSFAGQSFSVSPAGNGWTVIGLTATPASVPQAINRDTYVWTGGPAAGGWQTAANWRDATAANQATVAPGALTPVMLSGLLDTTAQPITGGGTAASLGVIGAYGLSGLYGVAGPVNVGTLTVGPGQIGAATTLLPGVLRLFPAGTLTTTALNLLDGHTALGAGATITDSGTISIGTAGGQNVSNNGTYLANPGAAGYLSLSPGATLTATAALLNAGTLINTGGLASFTRGVIGSAGITGPSSYAVNPTPGTLVAAAGGTIAVTTGISLLNGIAVADGLGAVLTAANAFSAVNSGSYTDAGILSLGTYAASLAAVNGGFVQVAGATLNGGTTAATGILVDNASTLEIGNAGTAARGAMTIDPARALTTGGTVTLSDTLINNGTVVVSSGLLVQNGGVSGSGLMRISNGTLMVNGTVAAGGTITFLGTATALAIGDAGTLVGRSGTPYPIGAVLSGFQTGDLILAPGSITSATYNAGTVASTGTLTLRAGTTVAESLLLAGIYTQRSFSVTATGSLSVVGLVSDAATVGVESTGAGQLTQAGTVWTLDLGSIPQGGPALTGTIGIVNTATGQVGALRGAFTLAGPNSFTNNGFGSYTGIAAGQEEHAQGITLATTVTGLFTETIVAGASSVSPSDTVNLPSQTILVRGTVQPGGLIYTLPMAPKTIVAGAGNDVFAATAGALNSQDSLDGGGGANTIRLNGGGVFDLGAPKLIANVQSVTATEGTAAAMPVIDMRDAYGLTLTMAPTSGGGGSATIYGGSGADTFNLSTGFDTVTLGSASDIVNAGGGTALVKSTVGLAGAVINGGTSRGLGGSTTLEITTGGTATLAAADIGLTVSLDAATNLSLGSAQLVTAIGSAGNDTITAGAAGQTLVSSGGSDTLIGSVSYGDVFAGSAAGLNGDTIVNFGGTDLISVTDLSFSTLMTPNVGGVGTITTLGLSDGVHSATITLQGAYNAGNFSFSGDTGGHLMIGYVGP